MTRYSRMGVILLIAIALWCGAVSAVQAQADLELTKTLSTRGPIFAGDQVIWNITLTNSGPDATGIMVTDDKTGLGAFTLDKVEASDDTRFNTANFEWSIDSLTSGTSATLNLTMTIAADAAEGELKNCVAITTPSQDASVAVCTSAEISPTTHVEITIKPETLNLKSRGVFTVFIRLSEDSSQSGITLEDLSSLECGGATPTKVLMSQKDGGTIIVKYRRQALDKDLVVAGGAVPITCEGIISADGEAVKVTGTDTIRVIGDKKKGLDAFFAGILDTILPIEDDGGEVAGDQTAATTQPTTGLQDSLNRGQLKKAERNGDAVCTENCNAADSQDTRGNKKKSGTDDQNSVTGSSGKENQGKGTGNTADTGNGNGNGKGNSNKPDTEKGDGKNKK